MRAVVIREPGDESVLTVSERPQPELPPYHVKVRVRFAGVNRADLLQRMGVYPAPPGVSPEIPGLEYAGQIEEIGSGVTSLAPGQRVFGLVAGGAYAEFIVVHEREAVPIPEGLSVELAAAIPEAFVTAYDALVVRGGLRPGERVLIHAVGSGVGTAGVQIAKALGCHVTGTSRTQDKLTRAGELGLDTGLLVETAQALPNALKAQPPFDVALDLVGGSYVGNSLPAMNSRGRIVVVGLTGGTQSTLDLGRLLARRLTIVGTVLRSRPIEEKIEAAELLRRTLCPWISRQLIKPVLERTFPLEEVAASHRLLASNTTFGKLLLSID